MISTGNPITNKNLPGVTIYSLSGELKRGFAQQVLVRIEPNGVIPLHSHSVDAKMDIVSGAGIVLSDDPADNGISVKPGDCVSFEKERMHGFQAAAAGLVFISTSDGIVPEQGKGKWNMVLAHS